MIFCTFVRVQCRYMFTLPVACHVGGGDGVGTGLRVEPAVSQCDDCRALRPLSRSSASTGQGHGSRAPSTLDRTVNAQLPTPSRDTRLSADRARTHNTGPIKVKTLGLASGASEWRGPVSLRLSRERSAVKLKKCGLESAAASAGRFSVTLCTQISK